MLKNIIANFVGRFWSILSNFLFIPLYIKILGFESYSIISFGLVITGIMAVLDAGLTATLSREFARSDLNHSEKVNTLNTLESIYWAVCVVVIILVFFSSEIISNKWITSSLYTPQELTVLIKILSFDVGFQLLGRFYLGGFFGLERQVKANIFQIGWGIMRNGVVIIVILFIPDLKIFFSWQAASTLIFSLTTGLMLRKELTGMYARKAILIEKKVLERNWKFAGGMLLISLVAALNTQMDKLAISKLLPIESLGYYTLALSLSMGIVILVNPISTALLPRLTSLFTSQQSIQAHELFNKVNKIVSILVFSVMSALWFNSYELIWIWTGNSEIAIKARVFVPIIATATTMLSLATIPYNIAIANGYTRLNNLLGIFSLFITLPGYWLATKWQGALGAAYVFCVVQIVLTTVYIYLINSRFFNEKNILNLFLRPVIIPMTLAIVLGFIFSLKPDIISNSRIYTLIWIAFSTAFTLIIILITLFPQKDLKQLGKQFKLLKK